MAVLRIGGVAVTGVLLFVAAALPAAAAAPATSGPDGAAVPTSQPTPAGAQKLLAVIREAAPPVGGAKSAEAMMDYSMRLQAARDAIDRLKKEFPEVALRQEVRLSELAIMFDTSYIDRDYEMKTLRKFVESLLADNTTPRPLRAMAEYHRLNADMVLLSNQAPASQPDPDSAPPWVGKEMDKRVAFAREYKDQEIGRQAFGEAVIYRDQIDGYAKTAPLFADFVTLFPDQKEAQVTLLAQLAFTEVARTADGWKNTQPIMDRMKKEYRDQPITVQALSLLAARRVLTDSKEALRMAKELTEEFTAEKDKQDVARCWRELTLQAYREKDAAAVTARLAVLKEKFPKTDALVETRATLVWFEYRQKGLDDVRKDFDELVKDNAKSPVVAQLAVVIAQSQMEKVGYEKAAPFVDDVLAKFPGTPQVKELEQFVREFKAAKGTSQPDGPLPGPMP